MPTTLNLALMACLLCVRLEAQQSTGFVLDMDGIWTSAGSSQPLSRGQHLPAGALLRNDSPSNGDRIVVANLNGEVVKRIRCKSGVCKECNDSGACNDPIRALPSATPQAGALASSFEAVMELFLGKPDRYSAHRVRGEGLAEAVLQLADGRCDLAPAFRNVDKGRYYIQFKSLSEPGSAPGIGFDPLPFDWDPSKPGMLAIPKLQPGLQDLILLEKGGAGFNASGVDAWVLLSGAADYQKSASVLEQATALAAKWGASVSPEVARGYLRANLEYLANRNARDAKK